MKKYSHSREYGSRINWRTLTIAFTLAFCFFIGSHADRDDTYVAEQEVFMKPVVMEVIHECGIMLEDVCSTTRGKLGKFSDKDIEDKIKHYFPRNWKTMIAIAHAESNMNMDAKGYNCYYNKDKTIVYETRVKGSHSAACKKEHRKYAWSVDCFALQRNYIGKSCPKGVTLDQHLKEVAELSRVQGLSAWSSYNQGKHLAYTK